MGQTITLTAADGHKLEAYRADAEGAPRGGLVVIQEIFGVNGHIRDVCDGFVADGYAAIADVPRQRTPIKRIGSKKSASAAFTEKIERSSSQTSMVCRL